MAQSKKINILHIAVMTGSKSNGVVNVVPQYLQHQSEYANVALLNCYEKPYVNSNANYPIYNLCEMNEFKLEDFTQPFNCPDLVVFHTIYYPIYLRLYKKLIKKNIPYVIVPHSSLTKNAQKKSRVKKIIGNILFFNLFIKKARAIQYLCDGELEKSVAKNKNSIIAGNGIEIASVKKEYKTSKENQFRIIYVGRYSIEHKGLDILIKAVKSIKDEMISKNIRLVLYGSDYRGDMQRLKKMITNYKLESIVEFNGPIYGEEKVEQLLSSDIFIQTSRLEGQPLGVMEAISLGLPCILTPGTNLGSLMTEENIGWNVEFDAREIGIKILEAYDQREKLPQMSKKASTYADRYFSWEFITNHTVQSYKNLIRTQD